MEIVANSVIRRVLWVVVFAMTLPASAWDGMSMPELCVDGRYLVDADGNKLNLHGFAQTYSPWFNERGTKWSNYDVNACLRYNMQKIDEILAAGWKMNFLRLHMDPYWSNRPGASVSGENDISAFDFDRFCKYLDAVFVPMAEYAISKGLYVVMRPPGVCPQTIAVGDSYHKYLKKVWSHVAGHERLKNNHHVMFELANEPINIKGTDGTVGSSTQPQFDSLKTFFQEIVDAMRAKGCNNILWIPGLAYQSNYNGYAVNPIEGDNIGYAAHAYPGWFGSDAEEPSQELGGVMGGGYEGFRDGWQKQISPVADFAPLMITEMDWAPAKYDSSWGKSITGEAYGTGFGANFKCIADRSGNVSWLLFTGAELLAKFKDIPGTPGAYTFLNDPEACPWPVYHWYQDYAAGAGQEGVVDHIECRDGNELTILTGGRFPVTINAVYTDGSTRDITMSAGYRSSSHDAVDVSNPGTLYARSDGNALVTVTYTDTHSISHTTELLVTASTFPLTKGLFDPSIWEKGTFDEASGEVTTGKYGFAGWKYNGGADMSAYKYCVVKLGGTYGAGLSFRIFDVDNYWSDPFTADATGKRTVVVKLREMYSDRDRRKLDPSHIYIAGFWSTGGTPFRIEKVYLTNNDDYSEMTAIELPEADGDEPVDVYTLGGVRVRSGVARSSAAEGLPPGLYVVGREKVIIR